MIVEKQHLILSKRFRMIVKGMPLSLYHYTHDDYSNVVFNPLFCIKCFSTNNEMIFIEQNKGAVVKEKSDNTIEAGKYWYDHEFFASFEESEDNCFKNRPFCIKNHENLCEKCPYWEEFKKLGEEK